VVKRGSGTPELVLYDLARKSRRVLGRGPYLSPAFSRDGRRLAVLTVERTSGSQVPQSLVVFSVRAAAPPQILPLTNPRLYLHHRFAADGTVMLFDGSSVYRVPMAAEGGSPAATARE